MATQYSGEFTGRMALAMSLDGAQGFPAGGRLNLVKLKAGGIDYRNFFKPALKRWFTRKVDCPDPFEFDDFIGGFHESQVCCWQFNQTTLERGVTGKVYGPDFNHFLIVAFRGSGQG